MLCIRSGGFHPTDVVYMSQEKTRPFRRCQGQPIAEDHGIPDVVRIKRVIGSVFSNVLNSSEEWQQDRRAEDLRRVGHVCEEERSGSRRTAVLQGRQSLAKPVRLRRTGTTGIGARCPIRLGEPAD